MAAAGFGRENDDKEIRRVMAEEQALPKMLVTERAEAPKDKSVLETPQGKPDVEVVAMPMWKLALVRGIRTYLQSLVGFILAGGTGAAQAVGVNLPVGDFWKLLIACGSLAVAPAVISLLQNAVEILSKLDSTNPGVRA